MKLGVMEHLVRGADDSATFANAKRLGFEGVELILGRDDLLDADPKRLKSLQAARRASGLDVPSLCLGQHNSGGIASANPDVARPAMQDVRIAIDWAGDLGAKV